MKPPIKTVLTLGLTLCMVLGWSACKPKDEGPPIETGQSSTGAVGNVVDLAQGWSDEQQQGFWFTSQGSQFLPYDWFLHLEQADTTTLFRSDENIRALGYIPETATQWNPDGLPLGFVQTKGGWMGLTCAACHTGQINYQGTGIRIDGGPTLGDFNVFIKNLIDAMNATGLDDAKFERFARNVLGSSYPEGASDSLRTALGDVTRELAGRNDLNIPNYPVGFGRLDASSTIFNQVMAYDLGVLENAQQPVAPASYPAIWDAPHTDLVQWNASVNNKGIGGVVRNIAEVLGVYLTFGFERDPQSVLKGYLSSADLEGQGQLENWLKSLHSPRWPQDILPPIDEEKAARGQEHYMQSCASCHAILPDPTDPNRFINAVQTPVSEVGTDSVYIQTFNYRLLRRITKTGKLEGQKTLINVGNTFGPEITGGEALITNAAVGILLDHPDQSIRDAVQSVEFLTDKANFDTTAYRARPLNGMWATAPYLHNGSIPNYWELLKPADQRVKKFKVGSREFDPVHVGLVNEGTYEFDATLPGSMNIGHEYGTQLTDEQKWELIEFLKTL